MSAKHISPGVNTSNPLCNCPHALKTHFTQCQHLKPPFQLPPCPQNTFHPVPTPETPFATDPMSARHISPSDNTSNPLFNCSHSLKTHFTRRQHVKPPLQLPPCPQNTLHPVPTPQAPLQLPSCPQNIFHPVPTPQTPFSTAPMPSKHISPSASISNPLCNCPHALKTHFTQCQHLKRPFQLPPGPQNTFHPAPTRETPFATAPMPAKDISPSDNTSNPLFNCSHSLKTHFTRRQHVKPPLQLPPCPQNTFHPVPTPQTPFSTAPMP